MDLVEMKQAVSLIMYCVSEQVVMYNFDLCALHLLHVGETNTLDFMGVADLFLLWDSCTWTPPPLHNLVKTLSIFCFIASHYVLLQCKFMYVWLKSTLTD